MSFFRQMVSSASRHCMAWMSTLIGITRCSVSMMILPMNFLLTSLIAARALSIVVVGAIDTNSSGDVNPLIPRRSAGLAWLSPSVTLATRSRAKNKRIRCAFMLSSELFLNNWLWLNPKANPELNLFYNTTFIQGTFDAPFLRNDLRDISKVHLIAFNKSSDCVCLIKNECLTGYDGFQIRAFD